MLAFLLEIYSKKVFLMKLMEKFSFAQMTSNQDGKTSGTGTMGILICTVGTLCFLLGCIDKIFLTKTVDVINQSIIFVGIGAALLGYRKSQEKHLSPSETPEDKPAEQKDEMLTS